MLVMVDFFDRNFVEARVQRSTEFVFVVEDFKKLSGLLGLKVTSHCFAHSGRPAARCYTTIHEV